MTHLHLPIAAKIIHLRDLPVLLDRDLAVWFDVKPTRLREQLKRNLEKFPSNFRFVLTEPEVDFLVSQNAIPSRKVLGGSLPQVFTECGVLQLANVLRSKRATQISIQIIEAFVALRLHALHHEALAIAIAQLEASTDARFAEVGQVLDALVKQKQQQEDFAQRTRIGFRPNKEEQGR